MRFAITVLLLLAMPVGAVELVVEALLPGIAVVKIDGVRTTLREGQSQRGVRLITADAQTAVVEIAGQRQSVRVSQRIGGQYSAPAERVVTIPRNEQLQYRTTAEINGVRLPVIVDTGANIIALNARQAARVGIGPEDGVPERVQTAGSIIPARRVSLASVAVGGIQVDQVVATVIDGEQPEIVLLGMSFLQHVELEERGGVLTLRARW